MVKLATIDVLTQPILDLTTLDTNATRSIDLLPEHGIDVMSI